MVRILEGNGPWNLLVSAGHIETHILPPGNTLELAPGLTISALNVPHRDEFSDTVAFEVRGPSGSLLYLPDIDKWEKWETPIVDWITRVDVAMLDGTFFDGNELPGRDMKQIPHPFVVESIERFAPLATAERDKIHLIHLNHTNPILDPTSVASETVREAGLHVAREGDVHPL